MLPVILNNIQIVVGTIAFTLGLYYFISEDKSDVNRIFLLLLGFEIAMINIGYGIFGFATDENSLLFLRRMGLFGIDFYLATLCIMLLHDISSSLFRKIALSLFYIAVSVSDLLTFGRSGVNRFMRFTNYTTYVRIDENANRLHYLHISIYIVSLCILAIFWYRNRIYKRDKIFAFISVLAHFVIVGSTVPDALFDKFLPGMINSNPMFIIAMTYSIAYFIYWYTIYRFNIFAINISSVSSFLFETVNAGVLVFQPDGRMALANTQAREMLGITEKKDQRLDDIFQISRDEAKNFGNRAVREEEFVCRWRTKKNDISCAVNTSVEFDQYHEPICILLLITDLTNEERLIAEANAANVAKTEFLANMSHEIRTPINVILNMNEMILRGANEDEVERYSEEIADAGERLLSIINGILDISIGTAPDKIDFKAMMTKPRVKRTPYKVTFTAPDVHILAIDDIDVNLDIVKHLLLQTKVNVDTALSGAEGLSMLKKKQYDVILMDHMMPEMDGVECLNHLRNDEDQTLNRQTPVIMTTANASHGAGDWYIEQGFSDYISKPLRGLLLEEVLLKYIRDKAQLTGGSDTASEEIEYETSGFLESAKDFLDVDAAMEYCAGDESFYKEIIGSFIGEHKDQVLQDLFEQQDWKNYQIQMHSVKSLSLMLGARNLSERAKELELSLKLDNDVDFVKEGHAEFLDYLRNVLEKLEALL